MFAASYSLKTKCIMLYPMRWKKKHFHVIGYIIFCNDAPEKSA